MRSNNLWLVAIFAVATAQGVSALEAAPDTAKWLLYDFRRPTANNAEFEKYHYGAVYENRETTCPLCTVSVTSSRYAKRDFAEIKIHLSEQGPTSYYANTGILFPIDPWWTSRNDLRNLKRIKFKIRLANPTQDAFDYYILGVALDGPALPFANAGYHPIKYVGFGSSQWEWVDVDVSKFRYEQWMKDDVKRGTRSASLLGLGEDGKLARTLSVVDARAIRGRILNSDSAESLDYDNDSVNILKHARAIKFSLRPTYADMPDYIDLSTANIVMQIDSIQLVGVSPSWPRVAGKTCHGTSALLDDFSATKPDPSRNLLGGAWWAVSDTDSFRPQSMATGWSSIHSKEGVWTPSPELAAASLVADLNRIDPDAHPDAGWASLFTNVPAGSLENLKAISMKIRAGGGEGFPFDSSRIMGVVFRAIGPGFADSLVYEVRIPYRQIRSTPEDSSICLDLSELRQPAWYTGIHWIKKIAPKDILRLSWSLILQDPSATTASTSRIDLKEVRLWGLEPTSSIGGGSAQRMRQEIGVRNRDGIRLSYSVPGASAEVRVVRMDGSTASVFTAPATVSDMPLPNRLGRGTYAIEVVGAGERRAAKFAVP